jgi:hypothetical protein
MSRYIDADALECDTEWSDYEDDFISYSKLAIATASHIDIVRCRECKHREEYPCKVYHDDDWFCADGERREP